MLEKLGVRIFDVELTNRCNLHCAFCPREALPPCGTMSEETFASLLEHVDFGRRDELAFTGIGEPLLHPGLITFIELARRKHPRVKIYITTNGSLRRGDLPDALIAHRVNKVSVSCNGITREQYGLPIATEQKTTNLVRGSRSTAVCLLETRLRWADSRNLIRERLSRIKIPRDLAVAT